MPSSLLSHIDPNIRPRPSIGSRACAMSRELSVSRKFGTLRNPFRGTRTAGTHGDDEGVSARSVLRMRESRLRHTGFTFSSLSLGIGIAFSYLSLGIGIVARARLLYDRTAVCAPHVDLDLEFKGHLLAIFFVHVHAASRDRMIFPLFFRNAVHAVYAGCTASSALSCAAATVAASNASGGANSPSQRDVESRSA